MIHGRDYDREYEDRAMILRLLERTGATMRPGLQDTPARFLAALDFMTSGYGHNPLEVLKTFEDGAEGVDQMVFQAAIPFFSLCEHHLSPFFGYAHLAYIPVRKIVGLSKLARLVEIFGRRLQVQERLCNQIASSLDEHLKPKGVGVVLQARHMCMESRGVQKIGTVTMTSALRGVIKDEPPARAEFMSFVQTAMAGVKAL